MAKLTELFDSLDKANDELNTAKEDYDGKEKIAADAYTIYAEKVKAANVIRKQVQDAMGSAFPDTVPARVRVA